MSPQDLRQEQDGRKRKREVEDNQNSVPNQPKSIASHPRKHAASSGHGLASYLASAQASSNPTLPVQDTGFQPLDPGAITRMEREYRHGPQRNGVRVFFMRSFVEDPWAHLK